MPMSAFSLRLMYSSCGIPIDFYSAWFDLPDIQEYYKELGAMKKCKYGLEASARNAQIKQNTNKKIK